MSRSALHVLVALGLVAGVAGCSACESILLGGPARTDTYFACKVCLADDATRCATNTPVCGDSSDRMSSKAGARDALCDKLSAAELARRPTPPGFEPRVWKNACYDWPDDAFTASCTTFTRTCDGVPIR